jgi:hypothetical protein
MISQFLLRRLLTVIFPLLLLLNGTSAAASPSIAGCPVFPFDNAWNTPVDNLPVSPSSSIYINSMGAGTGLHPDFGSEPWEGAPIGIPLNIVTGTESKVGISFWWPGESDPGPYPIPTNPLIEGGNQSTGDRHILLLDRDACVLYELYAAYPPQANGTWTAGSGAVYDLNSNVLRPAGWTSADAAGLPILPGLARYEEVAAGEINHALRFTAKNTRMEYVWPARHYASDLTEAKFPPMGQRFRLKAGFVISGFSPQVQVILRALQRYGMILADNGSDWYISGMPDAGWDDDHLVNQLKTVTGSNFEAVDGTAMMISPNSGQVNSDFIPPVHIEGSSTPYYLISNAYAGLAPEGIIQAREFELKEELIFDRNIAVTLEGGYNTAYTINSGLTTLRGIITVTRGALTVENLVIK